MSSLSRSIAFLSLLSWLILMSLSCTGANTLKPNSNDQSALGQIYEKSGWSFKKSRINLKASGDGAVEVQIEGQATSKDESQTGPLLLPIVLTRELPPYYRLSEETSADKAQLLAYQAKDGLWCIAAEVALPRPEPIPSPTPPSTESSTAEASDSTSVETAKPATTVKLRLLMVSPEFSTALPLLVPAGEGRTNVDTTVSLPIGARFQALEVEGEPDTLPTALTVMPPTLSQNEVVAAGRLASGGVIAWDFSKLTYSKPQADPVRLFNLSPRALLISFIVVCILGLGMFWIREEQKVRNKTELAALWNRFGNELMEMRHEIERPDFEGDRRDRKSVV